MRRLARFVLVIAVIGLVVRTDVSYGVVAAIGLLYVLTTLPKLSIRRVSGTRAQPKRVFHGEDIDVELTVFNRGSLPIPWLEVADRAPLDLTAQGADSARRHVVSLGPWERKTIRYRLEGNRRGYHRVGPAALEGGDWFGSFRHTPPPIPPAPIIVYPKIVPVDGATLPAESPYASLRQPMSLQRDPNRIIGVRSYEPGDPLRSIHWPATAATGATLVKQFEPADARELVITVDLGRDGYPQSRRFVGPELGITAAASIAHHAITVVDQPVGLFLQGLDAASGVVSEIYLPPHRTRAHLTLLLEMLARFQTVPRLDYLGALSRVAGHFPWAGTVLVCAGNSRPDFGRVLLGLRSRGVSPAAVITGSMAQPLPGNVPTWPIAREADIRRL